MAFCSFSTDMRTGPRLARSSRRMSAARCDMFLRNFAQRLLGAFQRNQQRLAFHFLQQALDTAIVDLHRVFEQEHLTMIFCASSPSYSRIASMTASSCWVSSG